jgi:hypothetical protein
MFCVWGSSKALLLPPSLPSCRNPPEGDAILIPNPGLIWPRIASPGTPFLELPAKTCIFRTFFSEIGKFMRFAAN